MTLPSFELVPGTATKISEQDLPAGTYAVVEQLGHATLVGRVKQVEKFGAQFLQIEPLFQDWMLPEILLGGASLYRLTPCSRATAWNMRAKYRHELPTAVAAQVPEEPEPVFAPAFLGYDAGEDE